MAHPFSVGDVIHGYAGGHFNTYDCRKIEAVGRGWAVGRTALGTIDVMIGDKDSFRWVIQEHKYHNEDTEGSHCPFEDEEAW